MRKDNFLFSLKVVGTKGGNLTKKMIFFSYFFAIQTQTINKQCLTKPVFIE